MTGPILPSGSVPHATAEAPGRFTVAQPLSAIAWAREHGKAIVVGDGEVFVVTRHPVRRPVEVGDGTEDGS